MVFLPMSIPTSWILEKKGGLRKASECTRSSYIHDPHTYNDPLCALTERLSVMLSAAVEIVLAFLRLLTLFNPRHWTSFVLISVVQLINGAIGPLVMVRTARHRLCRTRGGYI